MTPLEMQYLKQLYNCTEDELYQALLTALDNYELKQPEFVLFATHYTLIWADTQRAAVLAAKDMPSEPLRDNIHELLRLNLDDTKDEGLIMWKSLESHIMRIFPPEQHDIMLENAGKLYYRKAARKDWESVSRLLQLGGLFIEENLAQLTAGGMPVSFPDNFATAAVNFESVHIQFLRAEEQAWQIRQAKIAANNEVFQTISVMLKDGQKIFRNDEAARKLFIFSKILELISGGDGTKAAKATAKAKTNQKENQKIVNFGFKLENGATITVDHGDNTKRDVTGDGVNTNFYDKVYLLLKIFTIIFSGAIHRILQIHINNSNLTYFRLHKSMKKLEQFVAQGNMFPTIVVDHILITINGNQTSGPDKVINLLGSEPPSAAGLQAKAELESRGWIVLVSS